MGWHAPETRCMFATNCAIRKSFLQRHLDSTEAVKVLSDHRLANDVIGSLLGVAADNTALPGFRRLRHPRVKFLPRPRSLKNGHVGSIQLLVRALTDDDPVRHLRSLSFEVQRPLPDYVIGVADAIEALEQVWQRLRTSDPGQDRTG